ncbi:DUF6966 domain-containing protein [Shimia sagamensis]|uniref:DUF6966 domain-containing protein n=1 Tax=Shimia sagamensis TaxID=1566352 RepID=A0ABY1N7Y3_9RHOB|nr:hypothetical protein [Shimia sagamensis]SMP02837.1 hypothetical protein SAMN06265373_101323 [Shimia sagamensis]
MFKDLFRRKSRVERIHDELKVLIGLIESSEGREFWASQLRSLKKVTNETQLCHGIQTMYGGMGSFNDIVFHKLNGDTGTEEELNLLNERFCHHKSRLYGFTQKHT